MTVPRRIIPARAGFTRGSMRPSGPGPDHPRSRGVYRAPTCGPRCGPGSSPLARGLPVSSIWNAISSGIIPARAGFTPTDAPHGPADPDHPRSRGVYSRPGPVANGRRGSSPLARGLRGLGAVRREHSRIIPARAGFTQRDGDRGRLGGDHPRSRGVYARRVGCGPSGPWIIPARAGFTGNLRRPRDRPQDHPRSRGVYSALLPSSCPGRGSSPLARGLLARPRGPPPVRGIIPARAGFTESGGVESEGAGDHPRSRGVYRSVCSAPPTTRGSSPLARGLLIALNRGGRVSRIIPARAGFTRRGTGTPSRCADHPRSRGVYNLLTDPRLRDLGSSPLARGLPGARRPADRRQRIIPARAGFTRPPARGEADDQDHPRSRGVYRRAGPRAGVRPGSSPLARGLPSAPPPPPGRSRIIPARAGFTREEASPCKCTQDHPRSRGVYRSSSQAEWPPAGSSPLARGLHLRIVGIPTNP